MTTGHFKANSYRRHSPPEGSDFFPTPVWATRCFLPRLEKEGFQPPMTAWEPCNGIGAMAYAMRERWGQHRVSASDLYDYGPESKADFHEDFLQTTRRSDLILTNPPFNIANQMVLKALEQANWGVAFFLRTTFLEGSQRYDAIFEENPPYAVYQFCRRVNLKQGELDPKATGVIPYSWFLWRTDIEYEEPKLRWIRDTKDQWIREGDWDVGRGCQIPKAGGINYQNQFLTECEEDDYYDS